MRHILQRYLADPSHEYRKGFFGYSPKVVTTLVNVAVALHNRQEYIVRGFSVAADEGFHNELLIFLGYEGEPFALTHDQDLHIGVAFSSENIVVKVVEKGQAPVKAFVIPREKTPYAQEVQDAKAYFYTDNPLVIILGMFAAYRNRTMMSITTAPFGVGRWNQRTFYRLFIEAFNMVCTHESKGYNHSSRQFFDIDEELNEISSSHGRAGIREAVVKTCYGFTDIIVDFRGIERSGDCHFGVGTGNGQNLEELLGKVELRREPKHRVAKALYKYSTKTKNFVLHEDFFKRGTALNTEADLKVYLPTEPYAGPGVPPRRVQLNSFYWLYQVMTPAAAVHLEKLFTGKFAEVSLQTEGVPGIIEWYMNAPTESFTESHQGVLMIETSVHIEDERITWVLRVIDSSNFTEIGKVVFDPTEHFTVGKDGEDTAWMVSHHFVQEMMIAGFARLLNDTFEQLTRVKRAKVVIFSSTTIPPQFFYTAAQCTQPLLQRTSEGLQDIDAIVMYSETWEAKLTDRTTVKSDIVKGIRVKFMSQGRVLTADDLAKRRCNLL